MVLGKLTPEDGPHAEPGDLRRALGEGLDASDRAWLLIHFSLRCPSCLESLVELSREPPFPVFDDPVTLALGRWLEVLREAPELSERVAVLRPAHTWWLHHFRERPLGFARLAVEESRQRSLERPRLARALARAMDEALDDPRLDTVAASSDSLKRTLHDLRGLARAYHADACRSEDDLGRARHFFFRAELDISRGTHDDEIRATVYELEFMMARARLGDSRGGHYLDAAQGVLLRSKVRMPGRLAETWILQGWRRMQTDPSSALPLFRRALGELPAEGAPVLRYLAHHWAAAAAHLAGKPRVTRRHLRRAEEIELPYPMPLQEAQDLRLRGRLELASENWDPARTALRGALVSLRRLGQTIDAIGVLLDLGELCLRRGRPQELEDLAEEFRALLSSPESRVWTCYRLGDVIELAKTLGVPVAALSDLRQELVAELAAQSVNEWNRPRRPGRASETSSTSPGASDTGEPG